MVDQAAVMKFVSLLAIGDEGGENGESGSEEKYDQAGPSGPFENGQSHRHTGGQQGPNDREKRDLRGNERAFAGLEFLRWQW